MLMLMLACMLLSTWMVVLQGVGRDKGAFQNSKKIASAVVEAVAVAAADILLVTAKLINRAKKNGK